MTIGIAVEAVRLVEAVGTFVPTSAMSSFQGQDESQLFTTRQIMVIEALRRGRAEQADRIRAWHVRQHREGPYP